MTHTAIIDNEYASLIYYNDAKIVHHTFRKPISGEPFRQVLNTGIETLPKHGASKWLSDDRGNSALPDDDTVWAQSNWFPRALAAGWKFWALVVPEDMMARLNLAEFVQSYYDQGLRIMVFTQSAAALDWLRTVDLTSSST